MSNKNGEIKNLNPQSLFSLSSKTKFDSTCFEAVPSLHGKQLVSVNFAQMFSYSTLLAQCQIMCSVNSEFILTRTFFPCLVDFVSPFIKTNNEALNHFVGSCLLQNKFSVCVVNTQKQYKTQTLLIDLKYLKFHRRNFQFNFLYTEGK